MDRQYAYVVMVKPECRKEISNNAIQAVLAAIEGVKSIRNANGIFEFLGTRAAFKKVKEELRKWCWVQRERYLQDEDRGGG